MKDNPVIVVTRRYAPEVLGALASIAELVMPPNEDGTLTRSEIAAAAGRMVALINRGEVDVDAALLAAAPNLRIVANESIGVNNLALDELQRRAVWATNAPEGFVDATADCTIGLLLMLARRLGEAERFVRAGQWTCFAPGLWDGMLLRGKKLGLIGHGRIGQAVAVRAAAFGLEVIHHTRSQNGAAAWRPLEALLAESDIVSLHVPLERTTERLLDARRLAQMKPGALLVNLSRGPVVDEAALIDALQSGRLAGAALDVFVDEPRVPAVLRTMDNVVLTPHVGGGSREGRRLAQETCVTNVERVLRGEKPLKTSVVVAGK